jgi:hypothetical protein
MNAHLLRMLVAVSRVECWILTALDRCHALSAVSAGASAHQTHGVSGVLRTSLVLAEGMPVWYSGQQLAYDQS